jgi:hypothetical protein
LQPGAREKYLHALKKIGFRGKMIRVLALLILIIGAQARACEELLSSPLERIDAAQVRFSRDVRFKFHLLGLRQDQFPKFFGDFVFVQRLPGNRFEALVFEPNPGHHDQGYLISGFVNPDNFMVTSVERSTHKSETTYFNRVSMQNHIFPRTLSWQNHLQKCRTLTVDPLVQAKLWLKHRLRLEQLEVLLNSKTPLKAQSGSRYELEGFLADGRHVLAIVGEREPCALITAFELPN